MVPEEHLASLLLKWDARHKQVPEKSWKCWITNSNFSTRDKVKGRAISIRHTNLRALPTRTAAYRDPWKNTEGFPFDYNQNSALYPNTPLYISHYSHDRHWAFVHSPDAYGWVRVKDIALWQTHAFVGRFRQDAILWLCGTIWHCIMATAG